MTELLPFSARAARRRHGKGRFVSRPVDRVYLPFSAQFAANRVVGELRGDYVERDVRQLLKRDRLALRSRRSALVRRRQGSINHFGIGQ